MSIRFLVVVLAGLLVSPLAGQDPFGRITGRVVDSAGAVVVGARVQATNIVTNMVTTTTSGSEGSYHIRNLIPGRYQLEVEMEGFKVYRRGPIEVRVGDVLTVDVALEVGALTESVTVTAEAPLLESATASLSQLVDSRRVIDLPAPSASAIYLTQLAMGVVSTNPPTSDWDITQPENNSNLSAQGTGTRSNEFQIDGVPNMKAAGTVQFQPMPEIVQEFRVEVAAYDASVGHATGAKVNIVTKSGTNEFHGIVAHSYKGRELMTRPFFVNKRIYDLSTGPVTQEKIDAAFPPVRMNRIRTTFSGPLYIPKLYDGRNRTFWTFGIDQYYNRNVPGNTSMTVPTEDQRGGDFSALLALDSRYQIYDPATITPIAGGRTSRQPLPGNIVPASRIDPVAKKLIEYIPLPNTQGTADGTNNYIGSPVNRSNQRNINARVDHIVNDRQRFFVSFLLPREDTPWQSKSGFESDALAGHYYERDPGLTINHVFTPRPDLVWDLRYGIVRQDTRDLLELMAFDLGSLGLPSSLVRQLDPRLTSLPVLSISGYSTIGSETGFWARNTFHNLNTSITHTRGAHSLRTGFEYRVIQRNNADYGYVSPQYEFGTGWTVGPLDNSPSAPIGQGFASFLLGLPTGGAIDRNVAPALKSSAVAIYFQDDWRVTPRLTLNIGLRYELERPTTERYNRFNRGFDFATVNPVQAEALANYARNPIDEIPVSDFKTIGGLLFAGVGSVPRTYWNATTRNLLPRFGLAYQLTPTTVVRAGYGIYFEMMGPDRYEPPQQGFSQRTNLTPSLDRGLTFRATLADPFPDGLLDPPGASRGLLQGVGGSVDFFWPDMRQPYVQRWSLNVQREFPSRVLLEIGYAGNRALRLAMSQNFNNTPRQYLSTLPVRDQATIDYLSQAVPNPFYGMQEFAGVGLEGQTVSRSQLLRPYPHFGNVNTSLDGGTSWYHALQVRAEKRLSHNFTVQAAYSWSKYMQAASKLNSTDPLPERVVSSLDRPHRLVVSGIYELPFGRGKRWLASSRGWVNQIVGEWSVQGIYQGQSGPAIGFGNIIFMGDIHDIVLPRSERRVERWFNTDAGFERNSQRQLSSNIRTFPSRLTGLRADGYNNWDLSVFKNFSISEKVKLQVRAEAQDALNHAMFSNPNTSPTSTAFGQVTSTVRGGQRAVTLGARLMW